VGARSNCFEHTDSASAHSECLVNRRVCPNREARHVGSQVGHDFWFAVNDSGLSLSQCRLQKDRGSTNVFNAPAKSSQNHHTPNCARTVPKPYPLRRLGLASERKADSPSCCKHKEWARINGAFGSHADPLGAGGRAFKSPRPDHTRMNSPGLSASSISFSIGSLRIIRLVIGYSQAITYWRFGSCGPVPISTRRPREANDFNRVRVARWDSPICVATAAVDRATPSPNKVRMCRSVSSAWGCLTRALGMVTRKCIPISSSLGASKPASWQAAVIL